MLFLFNSFGQLLLPLQDPSVTKDARKKAYTSTKTNNLIWFLKVNLSEKKKASFR